MSGLLFWLCGAELIAALVFGGGASQRLAAEGLPELLALPLLFMALPRALPGLLRAPLALSVLIGLVAIPLLQLIPVPAGLWTALPGRGVIVDIFHAAGLDLDWRSTTIVVGATWRSLFSLLPALAVFAAMSTFDVDQRRLLMLLMAAMGVVSAMLAIFQILGGEAGGFYFYSETSDGNGVGFFANSNHFGALEFCLLPMSVAALADVRVRARGGASIVWIAVVPALLLGLALSGSRTAMILGLMSAVATAILVVPREIARPGLRRTLMIGGAAAVVLVPLLLAAGFLGILGRFGAKAVSEDERWNLASTTWASIPDYFPFGSGLGTFPSVFPLRRDDPAHFLAPFANHAHNDYLEVVLEAGLPAVALAACFFAWLVGASRRAFSREPSGPWRQARAGLIAIWLLSLHSLWDYPLRTVAMSSIFAFAAALQFNGNMKQR